MSEKIAVYIVSMGDTPQAINEFARRFCARFGIPEPKVLALSRQLPGKVGSYQIDKAKLLGIEIRKMGGQVSLRREATEGPRLLGQLILLFHHKLLKALDPNYLKIFYYIDFYLLKQIQNIQEVLLLHLFAF